MRCYAVLFNRLGMPSFVATLAGLLALLGMQLYILGPTGSINLPYASPLVRFGQILVMPDWLSYVLALLPGVVLVVNEMRKCRQRQASNLSSPPVGALAVKAIILTAALEFAVYYLNLGRGVPWMFGLFVAIAVILNCALTRTKWGRSMFAVGGNREAARRAGINVRRIYLSAFVLCSTLATIGGILSASRLASSSQQAGTGDVNLNAIAAAVIGGTSLFGGRGSAYSALLGIIVIQAISNGLTLLNLSSSLRYMITGAVLAIAVIVDLASSPLACQPWPRLIAFSRSIMHDRSHEGQGCRHHRRGIGHRAGMRPHPACRRRNRCSYRSCQGQARGRLQGDRAQGALPLVVDLLDGPQRLRHAAAHSRNWPAGSISSTPMPAPISAAESPKAIRMPGTGCSTSTSMRRSARSMRCCRT